MQGRLEKLHSQLTNPVQYCLVLNTEKVALNPLINKPLSLQFTGRISCQHCQKNIKKSYNQGYCYLCFTRLAQCDLCMVKPEICHYAQGTCRQPDWAHSFCFQPHYVYLANSSAIKVGITRESQLITRWLDQGAEQALPLLKVSSRYLAGLCEVLIKRYVGDKTNWQAMLKTSPAFVDLVAKRAELLSLCADDLAQLISRFGDNSIEFLNAEAVKITFPLSRYPKKIVAHNFDKTPLISGVLLGIKGQYLVFDTGVLNIRKYSGYEIELLVA